MTTPPAYPVFPGLTSNVQKLDILTEMVLDLYAQNLALMDLIENQAIFPTYEIKRAKRKAHDLIASTIGREGYDEIPDAEHLKRVALALKAL